MPVGETEVAAGKAVGQAFVIIAQQVQHRDMQVMDGNRVFDRLKTEFGFIAILRAPMITVSIRRERGGWCGGRRACG